MTTPESNRFLTGPILKPLILFALPLMLALLLQALYGAVDLAVVGQFSDAASVCAVSTGSQVMLVVTSLISGLTMGVTVLVGKAVGAGDLPTAGKVVSSQIRLFLAAVVLITVPMLILAPQIARLLQVPDSAMTEAVQYIRICSGGTVCIAAYNGISGIFRGLGNSRAPFLFVFIACLVNVALDLFFVGVLHLDAAGAAMATVIAQAVSVVFSLGHIRRHPLPFPVSLRQGSKTKVLQILRVGAPISLQDGLSNLSFLIITGIVNTLGVVASSGVGISEKLFAFLSIVPMAFLSALSAFVAQNMGAGNPQRAKRALFLAQRISFCCGCLMFLLTCFGGRYLAVLFSNEPQVQIAAADYMHGSSPEYLLSAVTFCFLGYFNGREHTTFVMAQSLFSAFFVRIPLSYFLTNMPGTSLLQISYAVPVAAVVNLSLSFGYFLFLRRRDRRQLEAASGSTGTAS